MMRSLYWFTIVLFLAGCAGQGPAPTDHYYRLPAVTAASSHEPLTEGVIFVEQLIADGIYRERAMLYAGDPPALELNQYHYQHWIDTPSRLIRDHMIDYLRAANSAPQVVYVADVPAELSIFGRIRQFERQSGKDGNTVAVNLEFRVNSKYSELPVLIKEYPRQVDLKDISMSGSVDAFASALTSIYDELIEDIREQLKK